MPGPLAGLRVLDFGHGLVGPWSALLLGSLGAEVIKVFSPRGDVAQNTPTLVHGMSNIYIHSNLNKKVTTFDLKTQDGRAAVQQLVGVSDVVVENLRPGVMERLGFGPEDAFRL